MMQEITMDGKHEQKRMPLIFWIGSVVSVVFLYFFGLTIPLLGPDEPRYSQVAREMWQKGDWVTPTLGGAHWFEKPALLYWLEMVSFSIFGVSEFSARFGSAIFGLGVVACLVLLGNRYEASQNRPRIDRSAEIGRFGSWLGLIAATSLGVIVFSRGASFDIIVTFPLTASLVGFFVYDQCSSGSPRVKYAGLTAFYLFIGVALIAKGLIGIVFPFAIVGGYFVLRRRMPGVEFLASLVWGTILAAAVASIWYWPMYRAHGWEFIDEFFIQHHFQRFTSNKYLHPQPFIFFFWVLPLMVLPWMPAFLAALWTFTRNALRANGPEDGPARTTSFFSDPLLTFAAVWVLVPLAFFSFSGSKLPGYILPSVPPAIVITATFLYQRLNVPKWKRGVIAAAVGTILISFGLLLFVVPRFAELDSTRALFQAANERGYAATRVMNLHTISHNAEFYASGRLLRDDAGKLKRLYGVTEVKEALERSGERTTLVLVPLEYLPELLKYAELNSEKLRDNGEIAIVVSSLK